MTGIDTEKEVTDWLDIQQFAARHFIGTTKK